MGTKENLGYVSRGALKLKSVLEHLTIDFKGKYVVDIGSSHGGFVQVALLAGAAGVYALDVGKGQLDWKLRNLDQVYLMEGVNARDISPDMFDPKPDIALVDLSFISLKLVLPKVFSIAREKVMALVKPQFEAKYCEASKNAGVIDDPEIENRVIEEVKESISRPGWEFIGTYISGIKGRKGNREYFIYYERVKSQ